MKKNQTENRSAAAPDKLGILKSIPKKRAAILAVAAAVVILLYFIVTKNFTVCARGISVVTAAVVFLVCFGGFALNGIPKSAKLRRFMKGMASACLIAFAAETLVFNFRSFASEPSEYKCTASSLSFSDNENAYTLGDQLVILGNVEVYADVDSADVNAVRLDIDTASDSHFRCYCAIKDGNFTRQYIWIGDKQASSSYGKVHFTFNSYEKLQSVLIGFGDISVPLTINGIYMSKAVPFYFSELRFYALFLILALISAIMSLELYRVKYNRKSFAHRSIIIVLTFICASSILFFRNPDMHNIKYTEGMDVSWYDPFVQMFDAVYEGHSYIDITPSEDLLAMENPYDTSIRYAESIDAHWDRAFYNGRYYSYYGIAPVLTYYFPYYFIKNELPHTNSACVFFGILAVIFLVGTVMAFVRKFAEKPNFMLLIMSIMAAVATSGIWFNVDFGDMYALPGITGTCYLMLCLWTGFEACIRQGEKKQPVLFVICGIAFALCVASKPTRALSCLILAPLFLELLFSKDIRLKSKIVSVASFMIPVIAGCGAVMAYNYARFESPFEFGAVYQLTVSNVTASGLSLGNFPNAILQYFLQPLHMTGQFPFVSVDPVFMSNHPAYVYCDSSMGALAVPWITAGIIVFPFLLRSYKREKFALDNVGAKKMLYVLMLAMAVFIAWFNYSIAGVILSYVCDILPILSLMAAFVIIDGQKNLSEYPVTASSSAVLFTAVGAVTVVLMSLVMLSFDGLALTVNMPDLKIALEDLLCFWS